MKTRWKTQKGDEWCYESGDIHAAADLFRDEQIFSIRGISCSGGSPTEKQIVHLLYDARQQFSGVRLLINLGRSVPTLESNLESLRKKGRVGYQMLAPEAKVEITYIREKQWWSSW